MSIIMPCLFIGLAFYIVYRIITKPIKEQMETPQTRAAQSSVYSFEQKYHNMGYTGVLRVRKKSETAIKALEFKEIHDIHVTTTPDKLVYTGATVGGVTTGGFHVQKGGTSASIGSGTGRWGITYRFASEFNGQPWGDTVVYMQLADQLFAEAKQDAILQKLIITKAERKQWRTISSTEELADVPCLLRVIGMDEQTANYLKNWLAGRT